MRKKTEYFTILFVSPSASLSLAAAYFYENIKKQFIGIKNIRFIVREYGRFFTEVNTSFIRDILLYKPDIVGFSCFFWNFDSNKKLSILAKSLLPEVFTVFGGPQVGSINDAVNIIKENSSIDAILCGEADFTFPELAYRAFADKPISDIPGLVIKKDGKLYPGKDSNYAADLSNLPIVYCNDNDYVVSCLNRGGVIPFQTLRGCKNKCSYCLYCTNPIRFFNLKKVEKEVEYICSNMVKNVRICDSHFGGSYARAMEIFDIIKYYNKETKFSIYPDPDHIDDQYIKSARDAKCKIISLGLETLDKKVSSKINRKIDTQKTFKLLKLLQSYG
ncbi:radical SAM protein, partial [Candidatus Poribacteria bacterium]|nr:radical SAM protein [Candidatus Poribacteria bacterium]